MRKMLLAAAGFAALAGTAGLALAQDGDQRPQRGLFQSDSDRDGVVTRQEFDASRDAMFARLDADNDGQLTRDEMRAGRRGHHRGRGHRGAFMMRGADTNEDGQITRDEFLARPLAQFDRFDANSDGVISAEEMPQRRRRSEDGERPRRSERPSFDANGDGLISRDEFASMGAGMFERLDADNDGRVTQDEARAHRGPRHRGR